MSFPVTLSPSPIHEIFQFVPERTESSRCLHSLSPQERKLWIAAEENPLDYSLSDQQDAEKYTQLLLKILQQIFIYRDHNTNGSNSILSIIPLDNELSEAESLRIMGSDPTGALCHYTISRLTDCVQSLKQRPKGAKATLSSTFYPSGILNDNTKILQHALSNENYTDRYTQRGAAYCLSCILLEGSTLESQNRLFYSISSMLDKLIYWQISQLQQSTASLEITIPSLVTIIMSPRARLALCESGGIGYICRHLRVQRTDTRNSRNGRSVSEHVDTAESFVSIQLTRLRVSDENTNQTVTFQQRYELMYCLWVTSFDTHIDEIIRTIFRRDGVVNVLADVITSASREKIIRLAISTLRNLACFDIHGGPSTTGSSAISSKLQSNVLKKTEFLNEMIGCGIAKTVRLMLERQWNDEDMLHDLLTLDSLLKDTLERMTTWDLYVAEIEAGRLRWGTLHETKFIKQHIKDFEGPDGKFPLVQKLIALTTSSDDEVVSIACHDIGEFIRFYPQGKSIVKRFNGRTAIIKVIVQHESETVKHQALICISKLLINNWEVRTPRQVFIFLARVLFVLRVQPVCFVRLQNMK